MEYTGLEIAIIGISAQFPGSANYREYWQNLRGAKELIKTFTEEELLQSGVSEEELKDAHYVRSVGVVDNKDCFDHGFFGYSPEEASLMDPQTRLLHEHCWSALDDCGYSSSIELKKIGVFTGTFENNNWKIYVHGKAQSSSLDPNYIGQLATQTFSNALVSYKLNLRGPSYFVDTACSTSLSAVHLACKSLLTRECSIALAGGVFINTEKRKGYHHQEGMVVSNDGHCRAFDAHSNGTAKGEGAGIVALKRLSEAIKDRDHIYAIIKSTSVNNDGNQKVGFTAPSVQGQADCIKMAHKLAGVEPRSISYIEAHGTGTKLGDPVEIRALNEAFGLREKKVCAIGSVKTNLGHTNTASGVAGLIKATLSLTNKEIPASLNFKKANPDADFDGGPFFVNTELRNWRRTGNLPLRAGVNSLGIGGTNVHVVLEEAPKQDETGSTRHVRLITISAKTRNSLIRYQNDLRDFLTKETNLDLSDMSYTFQVGRKHFAYRKSVVYKDKEELIQLLGSQEKNIIKIESRDTPIVFVFPGQGTQYMGMGRGLYESEHVFRAEMDQGFAIIQESTGEDFKSILFSDTGELGKINDTRYAQPLIFLVEYSLARLAMSIGIIPEFMIGHSIGEYVAACISGVFSYGDGVRLVIKRGELMASLPEGAMLGVLMNEETARGYLSGDISLAAINGTEQVVFSGNISTIDSLRSELDKKEIANVRIRTSHAFHSSMQDSIAVDFKNELEKITFSKVRIPFQSNLTGKTIEKGETVSSDYWVKHMRWSVKFWAGVETLLSQNTELIFVEVGAGHSLTNLIKQQRVWESEPMVFNLLRSVRETENDAVYFTNRVGALWSHGVSIDWTSYYKEEKRWRMSLPAYSFDPIRYPTEVNPFENGVISYVGMKNTQAVDDFNVNLIEKTERPDLDSRYTPPEKETEKRLIEMLEGFFGIKNIGIDDKFFELGGDSLKAMVLLKRIKKEFNTDFQLADFFAFQNIRQMASEIDGIVWLKEEVKMNNEIRI